MIGEGEPLLVIRLLNVPAAIRQEPHVVTFLLSSLSHDYPTCGVIHLTSFPKPTHLRGKQTSIFRLAGLNFLHQESVICLNFLYQEDTIRPFLCVRFSSLPFLRKQK